MSSSARELVRVGWDLDLDFVWPTSSGFFPPFSLVLPAIFAVTEPRHLLLLLPYPISSNTCHRLPSIAMENGERQSIRLLSIRLLLGGPLLNGRMIGRCAALEYILLLPSFYQRLKLLQMDPSLLKMMMLSYLLSTGYFPPCISNKFLRPESPPFC